MIFEFSWIAHAVLKKHGLFVDEINFGFDFIVLFFHEKENIF